MKLFQKYIKLLIVVAVAAAVAVIAFTFLNSGRKLKIDETANIVTKIREIGEFTSMCFYEEVVIKEEKSDRLSESDFGRMMNLNGKDNLVLIAGGEMRAGFDLTQIGDKDIRVSGDTLFVNLPAVKILDVICNPSDIEVYEETGKWSHDQSVAVQAKAKEKILQDAMEMKILQKAEESGIAKISGLFRIFGYDKVIVTSAQL